MNRLTLGYIKNSTRIPNVLGMCPDDDRIKDYVNEAQERLIDYGRWVGTVANYRICTDNAFLTWPRAIYTIESFAVCDTPGVIENRWYEFIGNGPGLQDSTNLPGLRLIDRGMAPAHTEIRPTGKKIQVVSAVAEMTGLQILLRGYDDNGNWIRTLDGTEWIDGELVTISTTATNTTNNFSNLTEVIKPATNGPVRLYEYDTAAAAVTNQLAYYEPSETLPNYRRSLIPGLQDMGGCDPDGVCAAKHMVTVVAKLRHIPVSSDNDFLVLQSYPAIKDMVQSIRLFETGQEQRAQFLEEKAIRALDKQIETYEGTGATVRLRTEDPKIWGGGGIENVI